MLWRYDKFNCPVSGKKKKVFQALARHPFKRKSCQAGPDQSGRDKCQTDVKERGMIMNRTAKCIQMLMVLRARRVVSSAEMARILETNPRNIREYRRELEEAGFEIITRPGSGGGYELVRSKLLSVPALSESQIRSLIQARDYFEASRAFPFEKEVVPILDAVISQARTGLAEEPIFYIIQNGQTLSDSNRELLNTIRKAIISHNTILLDYLSRTSSQPRKREVDPYELICMDGRWYLCGFDHFHKQYRNYRISDKRIVGLSSTFDYFERDPAFRLKDHIGQTSLIKGKRQKYVVEVKKQARRFFEEVDWGENLARIEDNRNGDKDEGEWISFTFESDNPDAIEKQLYQFKADVRLKAPAEMVERYVKGLKEILANYE